MPIRIQRKRTKGWKMPEGAVYVGRPTMWGNPWVAQEGSVRQECVDQYKLFRAPLFSVHETAFLRGKDLACWCALDYPCHADVLLEIANK